MAIYHLSATPVQRSKGQSAVAGAAYRAGEKLYEVRTDLVHDYRRKRSIVQSEILAPDNAPQWVYNREELWNCAEAAERQYNGQPAREIRLGLPAELTDGQRAALVFSYARDMFVSSGMVADISIHRPDRHGDQRNHHAHILLTMRELDGDQFARTKQRDWNRTETLEHWREQWEIYQNRALEDAGSDARVDHRTLEAQGIDREPTHHLGKEASAMEREGKHSRIGDENREVQAHHRKMDALKNQLADIEMQIDEEMKNAASEIPPPVTVWEATSPFTSEVTQAYFIQGAPPEEEQERSERRWYEDVYSSTIETVQYYWSKFVDRVSSRREEPERDDYEPER